MYQCSVAVIGHSRSKNGPPRQRHDFIVPPPAGMPGLAASTPDNPI